MVTSDDKIWRGNSKKVLAMRFVDSTDSKNKDRSIKLCNNRTWNLSLLEIHFDVFFNQLGIKTVPFSSDVK